MTVTLSDELAAFAAEVSVEQVAPSISDAARRHSADTLVAAIAGACMPMNDTYLAAVKASAPAGEVLVPGTDIRTDAASAASCMAGLAHSTEADDGYRIGSYHPGAVCVPAALSLGYVNGQTLSEILSAVIAGYEISCRISELLHPMSRKRGFHNTAIIGVFGAAATAGHLFSLDKLQMRHALGIAASSAGGLFAFVEGGDTKRLHPAHAVKAGIEAAIFAREGMTGPPDILQGRNGFLTAFAGEDALKRAADMKFSSDRLVADKCYIKPYACCRHLHPGMEAVMVITSEHGLSLEDISRIDIKTYSIAAAHADVGWERAASAQLSYPYCVAAALVHGLIVPSHFSDAYLRDSRVNALAERIHIEADNDLDARYPAERPASIVLKTRDGAHFERVISIPLGAPERPLDDEGFHLKLSRMLEPSSDPSSVKQFVDAIINGGLSSKLPSALFEGLRAPRLKPDQEQAFVAASSTQH